MEIYYSIMNILDYYAKNDNYLESKMIYILNYLALKGNIQISDIADANDCGKCESWSELVQALSELFKSGDRI